MEAAFGNLVDAAEDDAPFALVSCFMNGEPAAMIAFLGAQWLAILRWVKTQCLVLSRPLGRQVVKARDAQAVRELTVNRGLDEIRSQERERDRHIDLANAAPFSVRNVVGRHRGS